MTTKKHSVRITMFYLCLLLLLMSGNTAVFAQQKQVEIKLISGSGTILINGVGVNVEKPYERNGATLVPLRVITTAFGAELAWDAKTNTVTLSYDEHTIQLKIGDTTAVVDGEPTALRAAPEMKNDTTMVPLRFISENFGADVGYNAETQQVTITGRNPAQAQAAPAAPSLDSDQGKTKLGDSYYGWSMSYPSDLVQSYQSPNEDYVEFDGAKGEYTLVIDAEKSDASSLSGDSLLQKAEDWMDGSETVLNRRYIENGGNGYAQITSKNADGGYNEYRVYMHGGYIYYVILTVDKAENFKDQTKYARYQSLLDSFTTAFDKADGSIKDISTAVNGYRIFHNEDYGLTMKIPIGWSQNQEKSGVAFSNEDGTYSISLRIRSLEKGDSLADWLSREERLFKEQFLPEYRDVTSKDDLTVAGVPAKHDLNSFTLGDTWVNDDITYFVKNGYKFELEFVYAKDKEQDADWQAMIAKVRQSIEIDPDEMNPALGYIHDENDDLDKDKMITVTNDKYGYAFAVPEFWTEGAADAMNYSYVFPGGNFSIFTGENMTMDEAVKSLEEGITKSQDGDGQMKIVGESSMLMLGLPAKKYEIAYTYSDIPIDLTFYMFAKDKTIYGIYYGIAKASSTPDNLKRLEDAVDSFHFTGQ